MTSGDEESMSLIWELMSFLVALFDLIFQRGQERSGEISGKVRAEKNKGSGDSCVWCVVQSEVGVGEYKYKYKSYMCSA